MRRISRRGNEIERRAEAQFWREYDAMRERAAAEASKPRPRHRCPICGEYDDDPDMPCACKA